MPTLTTTPIKTPEHLSDGIKGFALDLIDQLDDLGDGFSNFTSVTDNQNGNLSTDPLSEGCLLETFIGRYNLAT